jgi:hypothetical protein
MFADFGGCLADASSCVIQGMRKKDANLSHIAYAMDAGLMRDMHALLPIAYAI